MGQNIDLSSLSNFLGINLNGAAAQIGSVSSDKEIDISSFFVSDSAASNEVDGTNKFEKANNAHKIFENLGNLYNENNTDSTKETDEEDGNKSYLEKTFDDLIGNAPEALKPMVEGLVGSFNSFLEGLFNALNEMTGGSMSLSDFTQELLESSDSTGDSNKDCIKNLINTFTSSIKGGCASYSKK